MSSDQNTSKRPRPGWRTAIATSTDSDVVVRGYDLTELIGRVSVGQLMHLVLKGSLAEPAVERMVEAVLVSSVDHGISPSSTVTRFLASAGVPLQVAIAGGVMSFGDVYGGACEELARVLQETVTAGADRTHDALAQSLIERYAGQGRRIPGYGHPQHPHADPRAVRLIELAEETGTAGRHLAVSVRIRDALSEAKGRPIPLNNDGAVAAVISDLGFDWKLARAFMVVPRAVGLAAHAVEEWDREPEWRHIPLDEVTYDGPPRRSLNGDTPPAETT